jgi:branched-chain amino acid transport system substrate-binding protein
MSKTLFAKIVMVVLVGALVFAVNAQDTIAAPGTKTLKIGGVVMMTGPASQGGLSCKQGYQLVVDKYNDAGGLKIGKDTYKIELIMEDDRMSPEQASVAAMKLITQDKANIIIGGLIPNLARSIYEVTSKAGALYVTPGSINVSGVIPHKTSMDVSPDRPLLIRTYHTYDEVVPGLLDYLVEQYPDVKTVALNHIAEESAEPMAGYVKKELEKRGLKQVGKLELFAPDIQDYVPLVSRILQAKPDAIFCLVGNPINAGGELKVARDLGFEGPLFYVIHADVALQAMVAGGGPISNMFGAMLTLADPDGLPQAANDVIAKYLEKYPKRELIGDVLFAYDTLWIVLQTIEKAQSIDPETIVKTYESLTKLGDLQTTLGPAYVGGKKTFGVNRAICAPYVIARVTDGVSKNVKFVMLDIP